MEGEEEKGGEIESDHKHIYESSLCDKPHVVKSIIQLSTHCNKVARCCDRTITVEAYAGHPWVLKLQQNSQI